jgi:hypothetical protein
MSTNFRIRTLDGDERHLGQRAAGWQFQFRAYPELGITDTQTWLRQLDSAFSISDEYGRYYDADDFLEAVEACQDGRPRDLWHDNWRDAHGNAFSREEFS